MKPLISHPPFPERFVWGAAAASYQIEGAVRTDGRGDCVWNLMCRRPGAIKGGHTGAVACDHYHRFRDDIALMREVGLQAYRFSISWPRVLPDGTGAVNAKGVDFYDALVDELLAAGIQPWVTLFHWDFPLELYHRGGWMNRDSAQWFADFARVVAERLSDRVGHWFTLNEPFVFVSLGHSSGIHAPGDRLPRREVARVAHNALRAHGLAVQTLRATATGPLKIGMAAVGATCVPERDKAEDIDAARRKMFGFTEWSLWKHSWWNDPVFFGHYPEEALRMLGDDAPRIEARDMEDIAQPLDFFGANIYHGTRVRASRGGEAETVPPPPGHPETAIRWPVVPEALRWGPRFLHERYKVPVVITENGLSNQDSVSLDGMVHDPQRIDYMRRHLIELSNAVDDGAEVAGYFHWSLMDNFEWAEGYRERFGLIHVDYKSQQRQLKDSAHFYRRVIETNGVNLAPIRPKPAAIPVPCELTIS